jgi:arylsulfatase A
MEKRPKIAKTPLLKQLLLITILMSSSFHRIDAIRDPQDRPNFVLFFVDDLGYGDCGFSGHPTTSTPNIDKLAWNGKILTTWYSACSVCSCSRAALLTGRQYTRTGVKTVFGPVDDGGLPLNETTIAEQLKLQNYSTAIVGKWHLGQRLAYLPGNQGFDYYLGIPYSDDMGNAKYSNCDPRSDVKIGPPDRHKPPENGDYAAWYIPLVCQEHNRTKIVEQPLDLTTLSEKFQEFATTFIEKNKDDPFFLYVPFTHVHATSGMADDWSDRNNEQYAQCGTQGKTKRGSYGDALADVDSLVGEIYKKLVEQGCEENTLIVFTSDNGPWNTKGGDGGSYGIFSGLYAGFQNTGKGSTWEGGIRAPAFAYWRGQIEPFSRSSETISSLDVFPTFSHLAGVPLPDDRILDGRNMVDILLADRGTSKHEFLFFYGFCDGPWPRQGITAVRHGPYKAHWCTAPGLDNRGWFTGGNTTHYRPHPLLFNVDEDPSEAYPISTGEMPKKLKDAAAMARIVRAYAMERATFAYGDMVPLPAGPGEEEHTYGLCCSRATNCTCETPTASWKETIGLFTIGSKLHHDRYHDILGEENHAASSSE